jgi:lipopolysaccharide biosynthesis glycosyltransferase
MSFVAVVKTPHRALVTLAIGDEAGEWLALSGPRFKCYAEKCGYDYIVLNERRIRHRLQWFKARVNMHLEKFQIGPLLDTYERILYLDADILLSPGCPDLSADMPPEALGVVADPSGSEAWKRDEEMANMQKRFGSLPRPVPAYFNAGVLVLSTAHRELMRFDPKRLQAGRWPDQTYLNYESAAWNLPRSYMDERANFLPGHKGWTDRDTRRAAWAVHYAGPLAKPLMRADAAAK